MRQRDKGAFSFLVFNLAHLHTFTRRPLRPGRLFRKDLCELCAFAPLRETRLTQPILSQRREGAKFAKVLPEAEQLLRPFAAVNGARLAGLNDHSIITPFDDQCAGRCYHFDLWGGQSVDHRRQRSAARARARSKRLPYAAFPEPDLDLVLIDHAYEFDVRSFGKGRMCFDLRAEGAPINALEIVHENATMWIAHRRGGELEALSVDVQPLPDHAIEPRRRDDRNLFTRKPRRAHFGLEDHARADLAAVINGP